MYRSYWWLCVCILHTLLKYGIKGRNIPHAHGVYLIAKKKNNIRYLYYVHHREEKANVFTYSMISYHVSEKWITFTDSCFFGTIYRYTQISDSSNRYLPRWLSRLVHGSRNRWLMSKPVKLNNEISMLSFMISLSVNGFTASINQPLSSSLSYSFDIKRTEYTNTHCNLSSQT